MRTCNRRCGASTRTIAPSRSGEHPVQERQIRATSVGGAMEDEGAVSARSPDEHTEPRSCVGRSLLTAVELFSCPASQDQGLTGLGEGGVA